mmetsp:Transcript_13035/g.41298  ORF Transcript_13035/g.41298 Transcript_13035/m.41298 type:complete len:502 (+) Transcript_13035:206-1711(+)
MALEGEKVRRKERVARSGDEEGGLGSGGEVRDVVAGPAVDVDDVVEGGVLDEVGLVGVHGVLDDAGDVEVLEGGAAEELVGHLVGGVEAAGHGAADAAGGVGEADARVLVVIGRFECHGAEFDEVEAGLPLVGGHADAVGPGDRVEKGEAHVWPAELSYHAVVLELDGGMNYGLRMHDDVDVVVGRPEEVVRLDDLEALVHHCRRIDGDFRTHVPVRVSRGLLSKPLVRFRREFRRGQVAEGAARGSQNNLAQRAGRDALEALEYGGVFRIGRRHRRAVLAQQRQDRRPARDQRFLVREGDVLPGADRRDGRLESGAADDSGDDHVRRRGRRALRRRLVSCDDARRHPARIERLAQRLQFRAVGEPDHLERILELFGLSRQEFEVRARAQRFDLEYVRPRAREIQGLRPNRARRAQHRDAPLEPRLAQRRLERLAQRWLVQCWSGAIVAHCRLLGLDAHVAPVLDRDRAEPHPLPRPGHHARRGLGQDQPPPPSSHRSSQV